MVEYEYPDEYEDEDTEDEQLEEQTEKQQDVYEDTSLAYKDKEDLYSLFKWVIAKRDSSKVGNLDKTELGMLNIPVRECQRIALLADTLKHPGFATFFREQAEIVLATSASKQGWLAELFVSLKRFATRTKGLKVEGIQSPPKKKGIFR